MKKAFTTANIIDVTDKYWLGKISFSKMVEILNEISELHNLKSKYEFNCFIHTNSKEKKCITQCSSCKPNNI
jgi:hypothetical protein